MFWYLVFGIWLLVFDIWYLVFASLDTDQVTKKPIELPLIHPSAHLSRPRADYDADADAEVADVADIADADIADFCLSRYQVTKKPLELPLIHPSAHLSRPTTPPQSTAKTDQSWQNKLAAAVSPFSIITSCTYDITSIKLQPYH